MFMGLSSVSATFIGYAFHNMAIFIALVFPMNQAISASFFSHLLLFV